MCARTTFDVWSMSQNARKQARARACLRASVSTLFVGTQSRGRTQASTTRDNGGRSIDGMGAGMCTVRMLKRAWWSGTSMA